MHQSAGQSRTVAGVPLAISLQAILELTGRLSDQAGASTPRERFRRFLNANVDLAALRSLIADAHADEDDQRQRAIGDLAITIGRFLGFDVVYGACRRSAAVTVTDGVWQTQSLSIAVHVAVVKAERAAGSELPAAGHPPSVKTVAADAASVARPELWIVVDRNRAKSTELVESWRAAGRATVDLAALVDLAGDGRSDPAGRSAAVQELVDRPSDLPPALRSPRQERASERPPASSSSAGDAAANYWIATLVADEGATADQMLEAVIRRRKLLPVGTLAIFASDARCGDRVSFYIDGVGVVGAGRLGPQIDPAAAQVRGARRFAAIFTLDDLAFSDRPVLLDRSSVRQRLALRTPFGVVGAFLSPISEQDHVALSEVTGRPDPHR